MSIFGKIMSAIFGTKAEAAPAGGGAAAGGAAAGGSEAPAATASDAWIAVAAAGVCTTIGVGVSSGELTMSDGASGLLFTSSATTGALRGTVFR